ncbi:unnamed protein product [Ectocarpus sp. 8 AP-2014]
MLLTLPKLLGKVALCPRSIFETRLRAPAVRITYFPKFGNLRSSQRNAVLS